MIGVFGGTFDPIHYGHLRAALEAKECFGLEKVHFVLNSQPPHRTTPATAIEDRLAMLQFAVAGQPDFVVDTREIERKGASYMVTTLASLRQDFPAQPLLLCIGSDAFNRLDTWYQWQDLFRFAHVVVLSRPGFVVSELDGFYQDKITQEPTDLADKSQGNLFFKAITQLDISASAIRQMISHGKSPQFLLPDSVWAYIKAHKLYQMAH